MFGLLSSVLLGVKNFIISICLVLQQAECVCARDQLPPIPLAVKCKNLDYEQPDLD
jgi:hypothetical protein